MSDDYLLLSDNLASRLTVGLALTDSRGGVSTVLSTPEPRLPFLPEEENKALTAPERRLGSFPSPVKSAMSGVN